MSTRNTFLQKGLFPETLPPCFDSTDLKRGFHGIVGDVKDRGLRKNRSTKYIRYVGTKHDGSRRSYASPNPISYFNVCEFIDNFQRTIFRQFQKSTLSISAPRLGNENDDRSIVISSLSELSDKLSVKIRHAPYVLKTDIAQFFPSIYTHAIPWVAHGIDAAKSDQNRYSSSVTFNRLDWYAQQCQNGQTRGVMIGPDAFRVIAEFIACEIDAQLLERSGDRIIGGVRHVDDYYIGVESEIDASIVLSSLREMLQNFELQVNDTKTKIIPSLEPINDLWAQKLRGFQLGQWAFQPSELDRLLDEAYEVAKTINSESPMKLALRRLDQAQCYKINLSWEKVEHRLQRVAFHFPHCIDYICLLLVKRYATNGIIDRAGWSEVAKLLVSRNINFNHHHELCWMLWMLVVCRLDFNQEVVHGLAKVRNSHISSMLIAGYASGLISVKPEISFANRLGSADDNWLQNVVARSAGFTRASFGGTLNEEFEHFSSKGLVLIDFQKHVDAVAMADVEAISRSKYGYDSEDDEQDEFDQSIEYSFDGPLFNRKIDDLDL